MRIGKVITALVASFVLLIASAGATNPPNANAITFADAIAQVAAGNLQWSGSAPSTSQVAMTKSDVTTWIKYNVGCSALAGYTSNQLMTYGDIIACRAPLTGLNTVTIGANSWNDSYYTATFTAGHYVCFSHSASATVQFVTSSTTVAPTASGSQLGINLANISLTQGSTLLSIALYDPSGTLKQTWTTAAASFSTTYFAAGAAAGAWKWVLTSTGGSGSTCDTSSGVSGSYNQFSINGTSFSYYA